MKYSIEPEKRKYVEDFFLVIYIRFGDQYGEKLMDTATKTGIYTQKTASKRVTWKTAEATGDFILNKIADKTKVKGKTKMKGNEKEDETNEMHGFFIPPEKCLEIIDALNIFTMYMKMGYQNITNLLCNIPDKVPEFITNKLIEVCDQSGNANDRYKPSKQIRF